MRKIICFVLITAVMLCSSACDGGIAAREPDVAPEAVVSAGQMIIRPVIRTADEILPEMKSLDSALNIDAPAYDCGGEFEINIPDRHPSDISAEYEDYIISPEKITLCGEGTAKISGTDGKYVFRAGDNDECHLRVFVITARWQKSSWEYIFAVRNPQTVSDGSDGGSFEMDFIYKEISAEYNSSLALMGGTHLFSDAESFGEFVSEYGIKFSGEKDEEDIFEENNVILVYDFDSPAPEYLAPEVVINGRGIKITKREEYTSPLDPTTMVRGYAIPVNRQICEVFDIEGSEDIYYSWPAEPENISQGE